MLDAWMLWLIIVGLAVGLGAAWLLLIQLPRGESDVSPDERQWEAAWIGDIIERHGGVAPRSLVEEVLDLHQAYLRDTRHRVPAGAAGAAGAAVAAPPVTTPSSAPPQGPTPYPPGSLASGSMPPGSFPLDSPPYSSGSQPPASQPPGPLPPGSLPPEARRSPPPESHRPPPSGRGPSTR